MGELKVDNQMALVPFRGVPEGVDSYLRRNPHEPYRWTLFPTDAGWKYILARPFVICLPGFEAGQMR